MSAPGTRKPAQQACCCERPNRRLQQAKKVYFYERVERRSSITNRGERWIPIARYESRCQEALGAAAVTLSGTKVCTRMGSGSGVRPKVSREP